MPMLVAIALIAVAVVTVAAVCLALITPRLHAGTLSPGRASVITLVTLLVTPTVAAVVAAVAVAGGGYGAPLYFYAGYAVGLVCFIVLNRRFRRIGR